MHMQRLATLMLMLFALGVTSSAAAAREARVEFVAGDGQALVADYYAPRAKQRPAPIALLVHSYGEDRSSVRRLVGPLQRAGFAVFAPDLRGHGRAADPQTRQRVVDRDFEVFKEMQDDLAGAYGWLAGRDEVDVSRFVIIGVGTGSSVALYYAARDASVDAVICLSPGLRYLGLDAAAAARQIRGRGVLLLATEPDAAAAEALERVAEEGRAVVAPGDVRGARMVGLVPGLAEIVTRFARDEAGPPTRTQTFFSIRSRHRVYHYADSAWVELMSPSNRRVFSSADEAERRGYRKALTKGPREAHAKREDAGERESEPRGGSEAADRVDR